MILVSFGRWGSSAGRWLSWKRIYWRGFRWTPFCRVKRRYPARWVYWSRVDKVRDLRKAQAQSVTDDYMRGLYNGLELALSVLTDGEPVFFRDR